MPAIMEPYRR